MSVVRRFLIVSSDSFGHHVLRAPPHQSKGRFVNIPNVMNSLPSSQFSCFGHNYHMIINPEHVRLTLAQKQQCFILTSSNRDKLRAREPWKIIADWVKSIRRSPLAVCDLWAAISWETVKLLLLHRQRRDHRRPDAVGKSSCSTGETHLHRIYRKSSI